MARPVRQGPPRRGHGDEPKADERIYHPLHADPYTLAADFDKGRNDPEFRTKLQIGAELVRRAQAAGIPFCAAAADGAYGDQDGFRAELWCAEVPFVMALKPSRSIWARAQALHTPVEAARALAWNGPEEPGDWQAVERRSATDTPRPGTTPTRAWAAVARTGAPVWAALAGS